jgi:hypothetical protein
MFQEDCYLQLCETETGERVRKVEVTNMRVGEKYQANLKESTGLLSSPQSKSLLIWSPVPLLFEKRRNFFFVFYISLIYYYSFTNVELFS